jgi:hypothetical protein
MKRAQTGKSNNQKLAAREVLRADSVAELNASSRKVVLPSREPAWTRYVDSRLKQFCMR